MEFKKAISEELHELFPDVTLYKENVDQGFHSPAFYVEQSRMWEKDEIQGYAMRTQYFTITYYPESQDAIFDEFDRVSDILLSGFHNIRSLKLHLQDRKVTYHDKLLTFTFNVRYRIAYVPRETSSMKQVKIAGGLNSGEEN